MYLIASAILLFLASYLSPGNIADIPLGKMTLRILFSFIFSVAVFIFSMWFFGNSLKKDRIWPWRWTIPYFGNLCIRTACILAVIYAALEFIKLEIPETLVLIGSLIFILASLFLPELNVFEEKKPYITNEEN